MEKKMNLNKATADVYRGAAFLILAFGFRTLARTIDIEWLGTILTPITVIALLYEFFLLLRYALIIKRQSSGDEFYLIKEGDKKIVSLTLGDYTNKLTEIEKNISSYNNQLLEFQKKLSSDIGSYTDKLGKIENILENQNQNNSSFQRDISKSFGDYTQQLAHIDKNLNESNTQNKQYQNRVNDTLGEHLDIWRNIDEKFGLYNKQIRILNQQMENLFENQINEKVSNILKELIKKKV